MKKKAQASPPSYWNQLKPKLQQDPRLRQEVKNILNKFDGIVWEMTPPSDSPNAVAYVSSEDADGNGKIDKIHMVLSNLPPNVPGSMDQAVDQILDMLEEDIGGVLAHEGAHIADFNPNNSDNPFGGGEAIAESAENLFHQQKAASLISFLNKKGLSKESLKVADVFKKYVSAKTD